jgi:hypothetical protein
MGDRFADYRHLSRADIGGARRAAIEEIGRDKFVALAAEHVGWLRSLPYERYLETDEWSVTRYFALRAAGYLCEGCGWGRWLEVHHRTYERLGEERLEDLAVLCDRCHAREHGLLPRERDRGLVRPDWTQEVVRGMPVEIESGGE